MADVMLRGEMRGDCSSQPSLTELFKPLGICFKIVIDNCPWVQSSSISLWSIIIL